MTSVSVNYILSKVGDYCYVNRYILFLFSFLSGVFVFPIIWASPYYADDLSRIFSGAFVWHELGRPLATMVGIAYSASVDEIIDPSPYNWIFCAILLSVSAFVIYKKYEASVGKLVGFSICVPLIFNPFIVENLLYRFDNIGMILGYTLAIYAASFTSTKNLLVDSTLRVVLLLLSLTLYQSMINVFLVLAVFDFFYRLSLNDYSAKKGHLFSFSAMILAAGVAIIIYYFFIAIFSSGTVNSEINSGFSIFTGFYYNYMSFWKGYFEYWSYFVLLLMPLLLILIIFFTYIIISKILSMGYFVICFFIASIFSLSYIGIFESPDIFPRMMAATVFVPIFIFYFISVFRIILLLLLSIYIASVLMFVGRVAVIQSESRIFETPIIQEASSFLNRHYANQNIYNLGELEYTQKIEILYKNTPFGGFYRNSDWILSGKLATYFQGEVIREWSADSKDRAMYLCSNQDSWSLKHSGSGFFSVVEFDADVFVLWGDVCL